jgi:hypothetical protein
LCRSALHGESEAPYAGKETVLLRFLIILLFLGGLGYGGLLALVTFVEPEARPMKIIIPPEKYAQDNPDTKNPGTENPPPENPPQ